jgi:HPt (histidine-containing phosphotransfer) domain-containing protein
MEGIRDAVARRDSKALEYAAHALKGSVGNLAAKAARSAAQLLEMMGSQDNFKDSDIAFQSLETEIENVNLSLGAKARGVQS